MSQQERSSQIVVNHQVLKQVADELFPTKLFCRIKARRDATWKPRMLVMGAILLVTGGWDTLTTGFEKVWKIVAKIFHWQLPPGDSYQGFVKQLRKWHGELTSVVKPHLQQRMRELGQDLWTIAGFLVFTADGSRIELARTKSLEKAFLSKKHVSYKTSKGHSTSKKTRKMQKRKAKTINKQTAASIRKKATSPQMWLTLLWHVATGLPWDWRTGPTDSSERKHLEEMLPDLPKNSLITADAGFSGYDLWSTILNAGHHFVIRVGGNVKLLKSLGCTRQYENTVYLWPDKASKKNQPPLALRLVCLHDGKEPVYLVTDLPKNRLSDKQAAQVYAARWGIELFFRTFKQTFGCRKLRSHAAENAVWELDWSLTGLWSICLLGVEELARNGIDPKRMSAAAVIRAFQEIVQNHRLRPERVEETFWSQLREALLDDYKRKTPKTSRHYPRKKTRNRISAPKIHQATKEQQARAQQLKQNEAKKRLTA